MISDEAPTRGAQCPHRSITRQHSVAAERKEKRIAMQERSRHREGRWRAVGKPGLAATALVVIGLVAAGCGSSSSSSSTSSASSGSSSGSSSNSSSSGSSSSGVSQAKAQVQKYTAVPTWNGPTDPVKGVAGLKGKLVVCVDSNFAVPFLKQLCDDIAAAYKTMGVKTLEIDGKGDTSNYDAGVRTAISQHAAGIALVAIGSEVVGPALQAAKSAGIPVVTAANDPIEKAEPSTIGANVTVDYTQIGKIQSDWAIAQSNGKVDARGFYGGAFPSDVAQAAGQKSELSTLCPSCKLKQSSVLISNFPTTVPPIVETAIRSDPNLNWFLPTFDALNLYIVPAVTQAGAASRVQSSSHNAIAANLNYVLKGQVQTASVGENTNWWGWATADDLTRLMVKQPAVAENIPIRLFTKEVIEQAGGKSVVNNQDALFGNVPYRQKYMALWGVG
jgi:ribose transport system substrate-binding protein